MAKIILPQNHVREFIKLSSYVTDDPVLLSQNLVYGHIKIEILMGTCFMSKTNLQQFVTYEFEVDAEDITMLIFEEYLAKFLKSSKNPSLEIDDQEDVIIISDGYYKPRFTKLNVNINHFPTIPSISKDFIKIEKDAINLLSIAKNYVGSDSLSLWSLYVHIKDDLVFSADAQVTFLHTFPTVISERLISLSPKECDLIANFSYIESYKNDNFSIFKNNNCIYGSRLHIDVKDMSKMCLSFLSQIKKEKYIKVKIFDFKNFCESTSNFADKKSFKSSSLTVAGKDKIELDYNNSETGIQNNLSILCEIVGFEVGYTFFFSHRRIYKMLNEIPEFTEMCISDTGSSIQPFCIWFKR